MTYTLNRDKHLRKGFTFLELVVVIAILGILAAIVGPGLLSFRSRAYVTQTDANLKSIKKAVDSYYFAVGKYPNKLEDLIRKPADVPLKKWMAPFLDSTDVPADAWNIPFVYKLNPKGDKRPYDLYSWGPNNEGSSPEEWIDVWK